MALASQHGQLVEHAARLALRSTASAAFGGWAYGQARCADGGGSSDTQLLLKSLGSTLWARRLLVFIADQDLHGSVALAAKVFVEWHNEFSDDVSLGESS